MNLKAYFNRLWGSFTFVGLIIATLFFAFSLTPSLLPRIYIAQGILSGFSLAIGYGVGVFCVWSWGYLQLPEPHKQVQRTAKRWTAMSVALLAIVFLWRATIWQNSIRELMEMEPIQSSDPWWIAVIAISLGVAIVIAVRTFWWSCQRVAEKLNWILPHRLSYLIGTAGVCFLLLLFVNDVLARFALNLADTAFLKMDEWIDETTEQPTNRLTSGSNESLISWKSIGLQGKSFLLDGPSQQQIREFTGIAAIHPLRIYVGLRSGNTPQARARLALAELKRVKAFDRSRLIVATPTGTGWIDPNAVDTLEYLHGGDTAIVSIQYSYLPSWLTILVDPTRSEVSAQALFDEVYGYWKTLDKKTRPKLYLHGLSLGSLGSESCADLFTLFDDPIQGAVWSGPPFPSARWKHVTQNRNSGSPEWLPTFRDGSMLRFTSQHNAVGRTKSDWGPMRFVYIQHASDPMVFFSRDLLFHCPDWLIGERGPDVSPSFQWYPVITCLQIAFDLPMATSVPMGYGHNYGPSSYIDAWIAVTRPEGWSNKNTLRLKQQFSKTPPSRPPAERPTSEQDVERLSASEGSP